jgi:DNA-directed RNA polymerase specialized sigma24 family protein
LHELVAGAVDEAVAKGDAPQERPWMWVLENCFRDACRREERAARGSNPVDPQILEDLAREEIPVPDQIERRELFELVLRELWAEPVPCPTVVTMWGNGFTYKQIAEEVELPEWHCKALCHENLGRMRGRLKGKAGDSFRLEAGGQR